MGGQFVDTGQVVKSWAWSDAMCQSLGQPVDRPGNTGFLDEHTIYKW